MDTTLANITSHYDTARRALEKTRKDYQDAMKNVPGDNWNSHAWEVYASQCSAKTCHRNKRS